jgi:N-acetyl-anhydromuramyl-L-alanine amidase AmpD
LSFSPDSPLVSDVAASPNHEERKGGRTPDMLLLHYTGMQSSLAALARLRDENEPRVSSHYLIDDEGTIIQLVPEVRRAWHAGLASWAGESDINSCSIGVEIANPGHEFGYADFPPHQIGAVIALCKDIVTRHKIPAARVLAHSDVAPGRKQDPPIEMDVYESIWEVAQGVMDGLRRAGVDSTSYELHSALQRALDTPDAARRWVQGEDVFAGCTVGAFAE